MNSQTMLKKELEEIADELTDVNLRRYVAFGKGLLHNSSNKCKNKVSNKKLTNGHETPDISRLCT